MDIKANARLNQGINAVAEIGTIKEIPVGPDTYTGEYEVTAPTDGDLVLPTKDKLMENDIMIEANHEIEDGLIDGSFAIDTYFNDRITNVKSYMFYDSKIRVINLPNLLTGGNYVFSGNNNSLVEEIYVPRQTNVGHNEFTNNPNLRVVDVGKHYTTGKIGNCPRLTTIIFRMSGVYAPPSANTFNGTPFAPDGAGGYIYVPQALLTKYQSDTKWQQYAHVLEFRPIEGSEYELEES